MRISGLLPLAVALAAALPDPVADELTGARNAAETSARHAAALDALSAGDLQRAITLLEAELRADFDLLLLQRYLDARRAEDSLDLASAFIEQQRGVGPAGAAWEYAAGMIARWQSQPSRAVQRLEASVALAPNEWLYYVRLVEACTGDSVASGARAWLGRRAVPATGLEPWGIARANAFCALGLLDIREGNLESAQARAEQVLKALPAHAPAHELRGEALSAGEEYEAALAAWQRAAELHAAAGQPDRQAYCLFGVTDAQLTLGHYAEAEAGTRQIQEIYRSVHDLVGESRALFAESVLQGQIGQYERTLEPAERALQLVRRMKDRRREPRTLKVLADAMVYNVRFQEAISAYEDAIRLARALGDTAYRLEILCNLASAHASIGHYPAATALYREARERYAAQGNAAGQIYASTGLAANWLEQGDFTGALAEYEAALQMARGIDDAYNVYLCTSSKGATYRQLGDLDLAEQFAREALAQAEQLTNQDSIALERQNLGMIAALREDYPAAGVLLQTAVDLYEEIGDQLAAGYARLELASCQLALGKLPQAEEQCRRALALARESGNQVGETLSTIRQARVRASMGDSAAGLRLALEGKAAAARLGLEPAALEAQWLVAECLLAEGRRSEAAPAFEAAIDLVERADRSLQLDVYKLGYLSDKVELFRAAIRAEQLAAPDAATAAARTFSIVERARARALLDRLAEAHVAPAADASLAQRAHEREVVEGIRAIQRELWEAEPPEPGRERLRAELRQLEAQYDLLVLEGRRDSPVYASIRWPQPMTLAQVQRSVLRDGELLLEYLLGDATSYLWVVTPNSARIHELPGRGAIEPLCHQLLAHLGRPPSSANSPTQADRQLGKLLLGSLTATELASSLVAVVADGALLRIPFETLVVVGSDGNSHRLVETAAVRYLPSASAHAGLAQHPSEVERLAPDLLAVAFGGAESPGVAGPRAPLQFVEDEVRTVAQLFPTGQARVLTGTAATRAGLLACDLRQPAVVHLAAHALVDARDARQAAICLGPDAAVQDDGYLTLQDVYALRMQADLVVLSACWSAGGEIVQGEGMVGLARAFLAAGAATVLASQWTANDRATALWMQEFYGRLLQGEAPADAARGAKLAFLHGTNPTLGHPYYWAPFVVVGKDAPLRGTDRGR